ncbi:MAG TPA: adenylate/guanylate cyclase domain-containing protein, partial [Nocardioidaceae bacterium]|nr:adenylate/guanylate cyclase domain-containing protein [Nocardioidaceae bacterium]
MAVTLLFTDIEGSTKLLHTLTPEEFVEAHEQHRRVLRSAFRRTGCEEQRTEGDSFFVVFDDATEAVDAAVEAQRGLAAASWPSEVPVRVRIGMHTGEPTLVDGEYYGLDVHRAARVSSAGHGGQILLSRATYDAAELPKGVTTRDLGEHRLKDIGQPEWIFQLVVEGLEANFPPLNSLETPTNLPVNLTSLIARDSEAGEVEALITSPDVRLVTVTGTGGTGKTRLALDVAKRVTDSFRNGVIFVDLTETTDPADVAGAIERALDLPDAPNVASPENVVTCLRDKATLLVLDNFEHVAAAAGEVAALLAATTRVKVLVTSRSALRIGAEREYPLAPLSLDGAVALFVERARTVKPSFTASSVVGEICERLDRLPLAIELAAARARALTPEQILARLGSRLGLLVGGARDAPARQQTLRDTIAWSYDLLPPVAAALLRRAAAFSGGATLEALEAVSGGDPDTYVNVETLLDQSLMRQDTDRFHLLETIREYAAEQAALVGETTAIAHDHAAYFADFAEEADEGLRSSEQAEWRHRLDAEQPNMRAALEWTLGSETPDAELGARLAGGLAWYWYQHGRAVEGSDWLLRARSVTGDASLPLRARLAQRLGILLDQRADKAGAAEVLREAVALFGEAGDRAGEARALNSLGSAMRTVGSNEESRALFERALAIRTDLGDEAGVAVTRFNLAHLSMDEGDYAIARELFQSSSDLERSLGEEWGAAIGSVGIASAAIAMGDL